MDFQKLKVSDFALSEEKFYHSLNERGASNDGEWIHAYTYTAKCKLFSRNVVVRVVYWNPKEAFDKSLVRIKDELKWLTANQNNILKQMSVQRMADDLSRRIFNSDQTRNMDDEKFMKFLILSEVRIHNNYSITLKFNEFDNIPGTFFMFEIDSKKKYLYIGSGS